MTAYEYALFDLHKRSLEIEEARNARIASLENEMYAIRQLGTDCRLYEIAFRVLMDFIHDKRFEVCPWRIFKRYELAADLQISYTQIKWKVFQPVSKGLPPETGCHSDKDAFIRDFGTAMGRWID